MEGNELRSWRMNTISERMKEASTKERKQGGVEVVSGERGTGEQIWCLLDIKANSPPNPHTCTTHAHTNTHSHYYKDPRENCTFNFQSPNCIRTALLSALLSLLLRCCPRTFRGLLHGALQLHQAFPSTSFWTLYTHTPATTVTSLLRFCCSLFFYQIINQATYIIIHYNCTIVDIHVGQVCRVAAGWIFGSVCHIKKLREYGGYYPFSVWLDRKDWIRVENWSEKCSFSLFPLITIQEFVVMMSEFLMWVSIQTQTWWVTPLISLQSWSPPYVTVKKKRIHCSSSTYTVEITSLMSQKTITLILTTHLLGNIW